MVDSYIDKIQRKQSTYNDFVAYIKENCIKDLDR